MDEETKALIEQLRVWRRSEFGQSPPGYMFEAAADALQAQAERVKALEEEARRFAALTAEVARKDEALRKVMPISVEDGPDYASVYFGDGSTHSTKAMTMNPQDWLDISAALEARND